MKDFIYSIHHPRTGICLYVGKTGSPESRLSAHKSQGRIPKNATMTIIRSVDGSPREVRRIEGQVIRAYKRKGLAKLNRNLELHCGFINGKELIDNIKSLQPCDGFSVATDKEQKEVLTLARQMQQMGIIPFNIVTRKQADGTWKVGAV